MPEPTDQPAKPLRTWRPMVLWTCAILLALGLAWFIGAVVVPVWQTSLVVSDCAADQDFFSMSRPFDFEKAIERLGGADKARHRLEVYLRLLRPAAEHRGVAIFLLGHCGEKAVPFLLSALSDPDSDVREKTLWALQETGLPPGEDVSSLLLVLRDNDEGLRATAAFALGQVATRRPEIVPALTEALGDGDWAVRCSAARSLGSMGVTAKVAILPLAARVSDTVPDVRIAAARALREMGPEARPAVPALIRALGDVPAELRAAAAYALGEIGPAAQEAVPLLVNLSKDKSQEISVRSAAAEALKKLRGEEPPK